MGLEALATFGYSLTLKDNLAFAVVWGIIGLFLAVHRLTTEELGLWGAMQRELDQIGRTLVLLERNAARRSSPRH